MPRKKTGGFFAVNHLFRPGGRRGMRAGFSRLPVWLYRISYETGLYAEGLSELAGQAVKKFWYYTLQELFAKIRAQLRRISDLRKTRFGRGELSVTGVLLRTAAGTADNLRIVGEAFREAGPFNGLRVFGRVTRISAGLFWNRNKRALNYIAPALGLIVFAASVAFWRNTCFAMSVSYNGRTIGYVNSTNDFSEAVGSVESTVADATGSGFELRCKPAFRLVLRDKTEVADAKALSRAIIRNSTDQIAEEYGLYVDGALVGSYADKDAIQSMLDGTLDRNSNHSAGETTAFVQNVEIKSGLYPKTAEMTPDGMENVLMQPVSAQQVYQVQKGDSVPKIASGFNMTSAELVALNPILANGKIYPKQQLVVKASRNFLTVKTLRQIQYTKPIAYGKTNVDNNAMYEGTTDIKSAGKNGTALLTAEVTYIDGAKIDQQVVSTKVVTQPVNEVDYIGKKPKPSTQSTGSFMWPIARGVGYISCPYGGYSGHTGVDIACSQGTPIMAADGGEVVFAGWNGPYGNCVIIQHANGFQTLYGHSSRLLIKAGQRVFKGQVIALVGHTGHVIGATGNHVHFQLQIGRTTFDPQKYLPSFGSR